MLKNGDSLRISSCIIVPCAMFIAVTLFIEGIYRNMRGMNVLVTNIKWESLLSFDVSNGHLHLSQEIVLQLQKVDFLLDGIYCRTWRIANAFYSPFKIRNYLDATSHTIFLNFFFWIKVKVYQHITSN